MGEAEEDWGELNTGKKSPEIYVLDLKTWVVHQVRKRKGGGAECVMEGWGGCFWSLRGGGGW